VDRRRPSQRSARGGGGIQAIRQARTRLILAALSAVAYAGVLAYALVRARAVPQLPVALGGIGALLLLLVLARRADDVLPWTLGCLGAAYVTSLVTRGGSGVDEGAPLVAAALLLCGELAAWSLDEQHAFAAERAVVRGRALAVALLVAAGLAAAAIIVALTAAPVGGGLAWTVLGALAAVLVVGTGARLMRG
jgi:hypothetical protein